MTHFLYTTKDQIVQRTKTFDFKRSDAYILTSFVALQHHTTAKVNNMYENMLKDVQESFRPMMDMVEINTKTAEKMFALQSEYMNSLVNTTMSQVQELTAVTDPQQFLDLQMQFVKQIETQFTEVAEKELATISTASDELTDIVKTNLDSITQTELSYMDEVSRLLSNTGMPAFTATSTVTSAPANTAAIKPATKPAPKKAAPKPATKKPVEKKTAEKKPAVKAAAKIAAKPASKPAEKTITKPATSVQPTTKADATATAASTAKTATVETAQAKAPATKQTETKA